LPKDTKLLGVRIPNLKKLAKEMIKDERAELYLKVSPKEFIYQEEKMLYSLLVAGTNQIAEDKIIAIKTYVPFIQNWSECDTFCASLKCVNNDKKKYYDAFINYIQSDYEYEIRFFYVIALNYFLTDEFLPQILHHITKQKYVGFYDKMAVAWFLSIAYIKYPEEIEKYLKSTTIDTFVFQKTINKIYDSFKVTKASKEKIKASLKANRYK
jgi:hypothetical protein